MPSIAPRHTKYSRSGYRTPIDATLEAIGGKYKVALLYHMRCGVRRNGELRRLLPGVTQRVLTLQLRELERDGLIVRTEVARKPLRVDYALSPLGRTLEPILDALCEWGRARIAGLATQRPRTGSGARAQPPVGTTLRRGL